MPSLATFSAFLDTILPDPSLDHIAFLLVSAVVAGLARGFSGFGGALIFVPLAGAATNPQIAAALLLIIDSVMTLGMVPQGWRNANRREVATMLIGALVGVPVGTTVLALAPR